MSDRNYGDDGNTDAPRVDTEYGQRSGGSLPPRPASGEPAGRTNPDGTTGGAGTAGGGTAGGTGTTAGSAPHRIGEERGSRGRSADGRNDEDMGISWVSVVAGWLTALGASLILGGIVTAIVGAIFGGAASGAGSAAQGAQEGGASGLIGLLLTLLLAFLFGGYVAGRMASRDGLKHGLLVPVLAALATIFLAGLGTLLGLSFIDNLSGVTLPQAPQNAPQGLGAILTVSGILALLFPLLGGALGGLWGARTGSHRP